MAGVGGVGSRVSLFRIGSGKRKLRGHTKALSTSSERLYASRETLAVDEDRYLFPIHQDSTDLGSYGTIQQIKEFKQESSGLLDFLAGSWELLCSTIVVRILMLLLSGIPLSMLIVGGTYRTECPKQPKLPLYLLVGGGFGLIKIVFSFVLRKRSQHYNRLEEGDEFDDDDSDTEDLVMARFIRFSNIALTIFLIIWFIFGNLWFYGIWEPNFQQPLHEPNNWCDKSLYFYIFYNFIFCYCLLGVTTLILFGIGCYYVGCCRRKQ